MTVYLIDDDWEDAELFGEALCSVDNSINFIWFDAPMKGHESLLKATPLPEILFLDLSMPQISGKELLKLLRHNLVTASLPVVIYSTSISRKDIEETKMFNVREYVQKPEKFETLCGKLKELIR